MFCKEWKIIRSTRILDNGYNPVCFLRARLQQSSRLPANRLRIFAAGERANAQLKYVPSKNLEAGHHRLTGGTMLVRHYMLAGNGLT